MKSGSPTPRNHRTQEFSNRADAVSQHLRTSSKGERTREHILETAINLFQTRGYETTTMREIAAEARCSLGLAYRYFERKEDLVLALYRHLANELEAQAQHFPPGSVARRFEHAMQAKLALVAPYRKVLGALFSASVNPHSSIAVLGDNTADIRKRAGRVLAAVVAGAADAPKEPQASQLALVLYGVHLAVLFFWLQDRSPNAQATEELLALIRDGLVLIRPVLGLPPLPGLLTRLTRVLGPMIGSKA